jgi:hypothetical protein
VIVALVTPATDDQTLIAFYEKVRPGSPWWKPVARKSSISVERMGWSDITDWIAGLVFIYTGMFGVGKLILEGWGTGLVYLSVAAVAGLVIYRSVSRSWSQRPVPSG